MPRYEYRCDSCGPFDEHRSMDRATAPAPCPDCSAPARRAYTAPGGRSRTGILGAASGSDRARIDRARSGQPMRTGAPSGPRLPSGPHAH